MTDKPTTETTITVCGSCLRACCWQGYFMCDGARSAGTIQLSVAELHERGREHSDWWLTDDEIAAGFDGMHRPFVQELTDA